ncbi:MAG: hypothetical protein WBK76_00380 [Candidatus Saccharimonadales bacterium]
MKNELPPEKRPDVPEVIPPPPHIHELNMSVAQAMKYQADKIAEMSKMLENSIAKDIAARDIVALERIWYAFFHEECKKLPLNVSHIFSGSIIPARETQAKIEEQMTFVHKAQIVFAAKNADMMLAEFKERFRSDSEHAEIHSFPERIE